MPRRIELLAWDTRFFGRRIARLHGKRLTPSAAKEALEACGKERIDCLYALFPAGDDPSRDQARRHGFKRVDVRVTLTRDCSPLAAERVDGVLVRPPRRSDVPALRRLAATLFPLSRFSLDSGFPAGSDRRLFSEWAARSALGRFEDGMLVAVIRGAPAGLVTWARLGRDRARLGLFGVARRHRGRGIGRRLLAEALGRLRSEGVRRLETATQARAREALRLYASAGFGESRREAWYTRWSRGKPGPRR